MDDMCRSAKDPDGPRSCSAHGRKAFAAADSQLADVENTLALVESKVLANAEATAAPTSPETAPDAAETPSGPTYEPLPANEAIRIRVPERSDDRKT